jgi:hypothetical protein
MRDAASLFLKTAGALKALTDTESTATTTINSSMKAFIVQGR